MGIIDYYSGDDDRSRVIQTPDPVGKNYGQAFQMGGVSRDIVAAKFRIVSVIGGAGDSITLAAKIYACAGSPGTDGEQTGAALATSDSIEYIKSSVPFSPDWVEFTFSTPYTLTANTNYCIVLECIALTEISVAQAVVTSDDTLPTHGGNQCYNDGLPGHNGNEDTNFYIYYSGDWPGKVDNITPGKVNGVSVANIGKVSNIL